MLRTSHLHSYRVNVWFDGISSHNTLCKLSWWVKVTVIGIMFGTPPLITFIRKFLKLFNNPLKVFHTDISDGISWLFYFFVLALALKTGELINPFPDLPELSFGFKDLILILYRLPNFNKIYKATYLSLPLIYLCFLTLRRPQIFILTAVNSPSVKFSSPVKFYSQNVFWVDQPW